MLKDITLGQYFPGDTILHRLDPRTKLILTFLYIVCVFTAKNFISYGVVLLFLIISVALSRISLRTILRGMRPLLFIIIFTAIINMFYVPGVELAHIGPLKITDEGIKTAVFMTLRILMLVTGTFLLMYTTAPIALTDGLETLMGILKRVRLPVHELALMMSIALRFIPTLIEETDKIMSAQKARGANFETGRLTERARALLPLLVPLFVSALRRADELAVAMESRCYHGGEGRTRMKQLKYHGRDFGALALGAVLLCGMIAMSMFGL